MKIEISEKEKKRSFTDDTSMTLCLAESLAEKDLAVDVLDQVRRYGRWYRSGHLSSTGECFDVGATTRIALELWEKHFEEAGCGAVCDGSGGANDAFKAKEEMLDEEEEEEEEEEELYIKGQKKVDAALKKKVSSPIQSSLFSTLYLWNNITSFLKITAILPFLSTNSNIFMSSQKYWFLATLIVFEHDFKIWYIANYYAFRQSGV